MDPDEFSYGGDESEEIWGNDYEEERLDELMSWEPEPSEEFQDW